MALFDVTELRRALADHERAAEFRERFVAIVSHDLRSPLSAITMAAKLLLRSEALPAPLARNVARIEANADRMSRMIADLLDLTRGRLGGGIPVEPKAIGTAIASLRWSGSSSETRSTTARGHPSRTSA